MRIIAGEFRSRRLKTLPGMPLRPTSDRLRETLFNILGDSVRGVVFVDCYAGSGAVGLEALSRGASHAIFLEQAHAALGILRENIAALGVASRARIIEGPAEKGLRRLGDPAIIFFDPPYADASAYERTFRGLSGYEALVIAEHSSKLSLDPPGFKALRRLRQGDSSLSFFTIASKPLQT